MVVIGSNKEHDALGHQMPFHINLSCSHISKYEKGLPKSAASLL